MKQPVLGILSQSQQAYSETFIKAHKELLSFNTKYYFGGKLPNSQDKGDSSYILTSGIAVKFFFLEASCFQALFLFMSSPCIVLLRK